MGAPHSACDQNQQNECYADAQREDNNPEVVLVIVAHFFFRPTIAA